MSSVELIPAFFWQCPDCDNENYVKASPSGLNHEDAAEVYRGLNDMDDWEQVPDDIEEDFYMHPEKVTCLSCGKTHDVGEMSEEDDFDEFDDFAGETYT